MGTPKPYPIDAESMRYLRGEAFSNKFKFPLPGSDPEGLKVDRFQYLEAACRGKQALHLGCCGHPPQIRQAIAENRWLHGRLSAVARSCLGIDINAEALALVRDQLGHSNVIRADLSESVPERVRAGAPWDVLVAGEIVEHLDNPVHFLAGLRDNLKSLCSEIIITVPNAFRQINGLRLRSGVEYINSDHRYWFTPYTLAKVLTRAGFDSLRFGFVQYDLPGRPRGMRDLLRLRRLKLHPALRDVIVMVASFA
jgi:hypothetical protein